MRLFSLGQTISDKVVIEPVLCMRKHPRADFKVARSIFDTTWYFTDRNLQELPLGQNNVSFKIVDHMKNGEFRGYLAVLDKDPETKDLAYVHGITPVNVEVFKEYKKGDPCFFNMKNIPGYATEDHDCCNYCGALTIDSRHPMYKRYSNSNIMLFHLKKGDLKNDVVSIKTKPDNSYDSKVEHYLMNDFIVLKPGETVVASINTISIWNYVDANIFDIHYDGTDITATKHFGYKQVFDLSKYDSHLKFDKSLTPKHDKIVYKNGGWCYE